MNIKVGKGLGKAVAEEAFWLAWQVSNQPHGFGLLHNMPNATKEDVLRNAAINGDYPVNINSHDDELYGDYVFGRMMKLHIIYTDDEVIVDDRKPRIDYQSWCRKYPSYEQLIETARIRMATNI